MQSNKLLKLISSLPIILISLYFIPFLGVCLIILRWFIYRNKNYYFLPTILISLGLIIFIPKIVINILNVFIKNNLTVFNDFINSNFYLELIDYSKFILCLGVIILILQVILKKLFNKFTESLKKHITKQEEIKREVVKENDMKIKVQQEKANNTSYVKCSSCGSDNLVSEKFGTCKYCRRKLVNKNYKVK